MAPDWDFREYAAIDVDIQNDFCPGGSLAVKEGDKVVGPMNSLNDMIRKHMGLVIFTKDWHPVKTSHFNDYGGIWPVHCIKNTEGSKFHPQLKIDLKKDLIVSKGMEIGEDGYSGFLARDKTNKLLDQVLKEKRIERLVIGGLATDYCVKATVLDGLKLGYKVAVPEDGIKAVNLDRSDGKIAIEEMRDNGALILPAWKIIMDLYDGKF